MWFDAPHAPYTHGRTTSNLKVNYFVDPKDIKGYSPSKLNSLDKTAEVVFVQTLKRACETERAHKQKLVEEAQGWFFQDTEKMGVARSYPTPACTRLNALPLQ